MATYFKDIERGKQRVIMLVGLTISFFFIAFILYSCSNSSTSGASEAEATKVASLSSFIETSVTTEGEVATHNASQVPSLQTLSIPDAFKTEVNMSISEIGKGIKYVQLETTAEALLGEIKKIVIDKNIYILTIDGLFVFSPEGRFIRKIGEKGKGPNEYLIAFDFDVNSDYPGLSTLPSLYLAKRPSSCKTIS